MSNQNFCYIVSDGRQYPNPNPVTINEVVEDENGTQFLIEKIPTDNMRVGWKIGKAHDAPLIRINKIRQEQSFINKYFECFTLLKGGNTPFEIETILHIKFKNNRVSEGSKWFAVTNSQLTEVIDELCQDTSLNCTKISYDELLSDRNHSFNMSESINKNKRHNEKLIRTDKPFQKNSTKLHIQNRIEKITSFIENSDITVKDLLDSKLEVDNVKGISFTYKKKDLKYDIEHGYFRVQPKCEICHTLDDVNPFCLCLNLCGECSNSCSFHCQYCNPNGLLYRVESKGLDYELIMD